MLTLAGAWALLYLPFLRTLPGWYGDETLALGIAKNLASGAFANQSVANTFVTIVYQPLYEAFLALGYVITSDIWGARFLNTTLALGIAFILFRQGRHLVGAVCALTAALLFLGYGQSILHFRQCYPHNGLAFGAALAVFSICNIARSPRFAWFAGIGNAIAIGSHPLGIYCCAVTFLFVILHPRLWIALALPAIIVVLLEYGLVLAFASHGLVQDVVNILQSYGSYSKENSGRLAQNVFLFFTQDFFHFLGFAGWIVMLAAKDRARWAPIPVFALLFSLALLSNRSNLTVFYYQAVPLLPFVAFGVGFLLNFLVAYAMVRLKKPAFGPLLHALPVALAVILSVLSLVSVFRKTLIPRNHPWVTQSTSDVDKAAAWLRGHTDGPDLVIANSNISWLLDVPTANLLQLTAWQGHKTFMYEYGITRDRFIYNLDASKIKYLVVGDIDFVWGIHQPHVQDALQALNANEWKQVWGSDTYVILENPKFQK